MEIEYSIQGFKEVVFCLLFVLMCNMIYSNLLSRTSIWIIRSYKVQNNDNEKSPITGDSAALKQDTIHGIKTLAGHKKLPQWMDCLHYWLAKIS